MATGPTGPAMKSFGVEYRSTHAAATMTVEAEDRERAVEAALAQIEVDDGGSVEIIRTVELPAGAGSGATGATGTTGASSSTHLSRHHR